MIAHTDIQFISLWKSRLKIRVTSIMREPFGSLKSYICIFALYLAFFGGFLPQQFPCSLTWRWRLLQRNGPVGGRNGSVSMPSWWFTMGMRCVKSRTSTLFCKTVMCRRTTTGQRTWYDRLQSAVRIGFLAIQQTVQRAVQSCIRLLQPLRQTVWT